MSVFHKPLRPTDEWTDIHTTGLLELLRAAKKLSGNTMQFNGVDSNKTYLYIKTLVVTLKHLAVK